MGISLSYLHISYCNWYVGLTLYLHARVIDNIPAITYSCITPMTLGFGTISICLFYITYRYNVLYVFNAKIDTHGKSYCRALQHLTVGCYSLNICLIAIFTLYSTANKVAIGPLAIMIIFLILTVLYHMSMISALKPLLDSVPETIDRQKDFNISKLDDGLAGEPNLPANDLCDETPFQADKVSTRTSIQPSIATPFKRILEWVADLCQQNHSSNVRHLLSGPLYEKSSERNAGCESYQHPAISSEPPVLWIPHDSAGVSGYEIASSSSVLPVTDENATLDDQCHIALNIGKEDAAG